MITLKRKYRAGAGYYTFKSLTLPPIQKEFSNYQVDFFSNPREDLVADSISVPLHL